MKKTLSLLVIAVILYSCGSSKKFYQRGQYDMAISKAVKKLRKKPNKEKEILILEQAYTKANNKDNERISFLKLEGNPEMWGELFNRYSKMKNRQSLVRDVLPLEVPSTGRMVQFSMVNYDEEIINAKKKAAEYYYTYGKTLLDKGDRENAKRAYLEFKKVKSYYNDFRDINELMKEALFLATLKVIAEPIPMHSQSLQLSNQFFDNKINEFLGQMPASDFVKFYTQKEAESIGLTNPDHIVQLVFDEFMVGNSNVKEVIKDFSKDNVIKGITVGNELKTGTDKVNICHKFKVSGTASQKTISIEVNEWESHKDHGDYLSSCAPAGTTPTPTSKEFYGTVKATLFLTTKTLISNGILDFKVLDARTGKVLTQEKFPGEFGWQCQWGHYQGDSRALSQKDIDACKGKELQPPPPQDLFIEFTKPIYDQLTNKVRDFYRNY